MKIQQDLVAADMSLQTTHDSSPLLAFIAMRVPLFSSLVTIPSLPFVVVVVVVVIVVIASFNDNDDDDDAVAANIRLVVARRLLRISTVWCVRSANGKKIQ